MQVIDDEPTFVRIIEAQNACGYIVKYDYLDKLINLYEYAVVQLGTTFEHYLYMNDQIWKKLQIHDKWFCFIKKMARQRPGFSNLSQQFVCND
jgi:glycyl-tRNA synthetase beta subunit